MSCAADSNAERAERCANHSTAGRSRYLAFDVGADAFALPFADITEVRTLANASPVLRPPDYGTGFVVVRGAAIPVLDLRVRFGAPAALGGDTRLLVCRRAEGERVWFRALIVDRVNDLFEIDGEQLEPVPAIHAPGADQPVVATCLTAAGRKQVLALEHLAEPLPPSALPPA
jgi:purine-binding chemotaxis protein CheW